MLPSNLRLTRNTFNTCIKRDHKVVYNRLGTLKYTLENKGFSIVTSSKNEKSAVIRNKLRRRVYSLLNKDNVTFCGALYVSKHAYNMEFNEIKNLFYDLLAKIDKNS